MGCLKWLSEAHAEESTILFIHSCCDAGQTGNAYFSTTSDCHGLKCVMITFQTDNKTGESKTMKNKQNRNKYLEIGWFCLLFFIMHRNIKRVHKKTFTIKFYGFSCIWEEKTSLTFISQADFILFILFSFCFCSLAIYIVFTPLTIIPIHFRHIIIDTVSISLRKENSLRYGIENIIEMEWKRKENSGTKSRQFMNANDNVTFYLTMI